MASASLDALIQASTSSVPNASDRNVHRAIWNAVIHEGGEIVGESDSHVVEGECIKVAGEVFEFSCVGACRAAHLCNWPLCAYLAAMCFRNHGAESLAEINSAWFNEAWVNIVAPIVVDVPLGCERLRVKCYDSDQEEWISTACLATESVLGREVEVEHRGIATFCYAEYFKEGAAVQPVKFKRVQLPEPAIVEMRKYLSSNDAGTDKRFKSLTFLDNIFPKLPIRNVWYHVLAYPFGGDFTKALLRPQVDAWTPLQRSSLRALSETLISSCAKAGKWDLVSVLLQSGVRCPDLTREFQDLCNHSSIALQAWRRDLVIASGAVHGPPSLLELVAWQSVKNEWNDSELSPLHDVMEALKSSNQDLDLGGRTNKRPPLIRAAAERGHWSVVLDLLEAEDTNVFARSLLRSRAIEKAPHTVKIRAEERARQEMIAAATKPSESLAEYFNRQLSGPISNDETVPCGFKLDSGVLYGDGGLQILDCGFKLVSRQGKELVFVKLEADDMEKTKNEIRDPAMKVLSLELDRRECRLRDPLPEDGSSCWISLITDECCLKKDELGAMSICIPGDQPMYAHIMRKYDVHVSVVSCCCREPLAKVPVYASGIYAGATNIDGVAKFRLPPGKFTIESLGYAQDFAEIDITPEQCDTLHVELSSSGELFVYLQDFGTDDDPKDSVFVCADRAQIPSDAESFKGFATMPGCVGFCVPKGTHCSEKMSQMKIKSSDGRRFKWKKDLTWFKDFMDECEIAVLFHGTPIRLGDLKGLRPSELVGQKAVSDAVREVGPSGSRSTSKPRLGVPARKRPSTQESGSINGAFASQRRPRSANLNAKPSRLSRPASAQRGRPNIEAVAFNGKALSFRSLRASYH